jgi:hypothetical protein
MIASWCIRRSERKKFKSWSNSNYYVAQAASLLYRRLPVGKGHSAIRVEKIPQSDNSICAKYKMETVE